MYKDQLVRAGLTEHQAAVYEVLVAQGALQARAISRRSAIPRTLAYAILSDLEKLGLVTRQKARGSVSMFSAAHPFRLQEFVRARQHAAEKARGSLEEIFAGLVSDFTIRYGKPGIRILKGSEGIQELYDDVLREKNPIAIIGSPLLSRFPALRPLVERQVARQVRVGISARILMPVRPGSLSEVMQKDAKRRTKRRFISDKNFRPPAQVVIYAGKVALTSFGDEITTTIIENQDTHATFLMLFDFMWQAARAGHEALLRSEQLA